MFHLRKPADLLQGLTLHLSYGAAEAEATARGQGWEVWTVNAIGLPVKAEPPAPPAP